MEPAVPAVVNAPRVPPRPARCPPLARPLSTTYFMPSRGDPTLQGIDRRVSEFTRIPESHQEQVQVLKYDVTQRYTAHHDFL